jgi:transposase-like protein
MVTAMDIRMACVLSGAVGNVSEFCRQRAISRQTYYKWQKRFSQEAEAGLADRSRRPRRCPHATPAQVEEAIVRLRKQLAEDGEFNGPVTIADRLAAEGVQPPSRATIARILFRRGMVKPAPRKRPRRSYRRFQASRPNEMPRQHRTCGQASCRPKLRQIAVLGTVGLRQAARQTGYPGRC